MPESDYTSPIKSGKRLQEIAGVLIILGCLYLLVSLLSYNRWDSSLFVYSPKPSSNYGGITGAYLADAIMSLIGLSGYVFTAFAIFYGLMKILGRPVYKLQMAGAALFIIAFSMALQLISEYLPSVMEAPGGLAGFGLSDLLSGLVSKLGASIICIAFLATSIIIMSPVSIFTALSPKEKEKRKKRSAANRTFDEDEADETTAADDEEDIFIVTPRKSAGMRQAAPVKAVGSDGYEMPSTDFLSDPDDIPEPSREDLSAAAAGLERKLSDFGVSGKIKQAYPGPIVTMFEFEPAAGVKINRIVSLSDDLALALRAQSIRVYPIAGKAAIGIEVPNKQRATVTLKEIIASDSFQRSPSLLSLALGKDIFGTPIVTDLAKMPHLLVAGATGSGKSVSINSMIMSLLYKASPDQVKMLMIDPKLLELSSYSDIPHLISPVITSPKEASDALKKMVIEMERRYRLIAEKGARNIESYNKNVEEEDRLPYIVVFIDELADLMFTAPNDVENAIARLAQMARASGIHLILATQRPSVDVITGLIKANFPARISFQVTSRIDSRTILDAQGAEQLLGMGDMLFMVPGLKIMRIHGAFVSDAEVRAVTDFARAQRSPDYSTFNSLVLAASHSSDSADSDERDEFYQKAIDFAESVGEISISSIQRRFKIGYNRAARIMELFEEDGLVGPPKGAGKPRDFLRRF
ncbi:MAG: DNA translocase FtsK [Nitrospiraceae bacterium]|nr:DNA translocase FtsK [Nitrospiraceae bacterium]